ncbi:hypothetical protein IIA15_09680 [candidate division TA06 bacterium]|nr:hypothetical protein [candidate division TA06 bacterium]
MKYLIGVLCVLLAPLGGAGVLCVSAVNEASAQTVVIPEKTEVKVLIDPGLTTANEPKKRTLYFKVAESVALFDVVVFEEGASVKATITKFKKRGYLGKPGKIAVTIEAVQAQDGTFIPVRPIRISHQGKSQKTIALPLLLLLGAGYFIKGGAATIPQGETVVVATKERYFFKRD